MKIHMRSSIGEIKEIKLGFSWTMLFFGFFVPLIRGDWKWAIISLIASAFTVGICWLVFPFVYNKIYIKDKIEHGWIPADTITADALRRKGIFFPEDKFNEMMQTVTPQTVTEVSQAESK